MAPTDRMSNSYNEYRSWLGRERERDAKRKRGGGRGGKERGIKRAGSAENRWFTNEEKRWRGIHSKSRVANSITL